MALWIRALIFKVYLSPLLVRALLGAQVRKPSCAVFLPGDTNHIFVMFGLVLCSP